MARSPAPRTLTCRACSSHGAEAGSLGQGSAFGAFPTSRPHVTSHCPLQRWRPRGRRAGAHLDLPPHHPAKPAQQAAQGGSPARRPEGWPSPGLVGGSGLWGPTSWDACSPGVVLQETRMGWGAHSCLSPLLLPCSPLHALRL